MSHAGLRRRRALTAALLFGTGVLTAVLGCQSIADIPEVSYSPTCNEYCDQMATQCPAGDAQYEDRRTCLEVCTLLDKNANSNLKNANTIACRLSKLQKAGLAGTATTDRLQLCAQAGPGGSDGCTLEADAPNCEGYCALYVLACDGHSENPFKGALGKDQSGDQGQCLAKCRSLVPMDGHYTWRGGLNSGDTLGCRLYFASAAVVDPVTYCDFAGIRPAGECLGPDLDPSCESFCRVLDNACADDDLRVYENIEQCKAVCHATEPGTEQSTASVNTIGCRTAHAYNALLIDAKAHCPHIGPLGANVCGDAGNCEAYCHLAKEACPSEFTSNYQDDDDVCQEKCGTVKGHDKGDYSVKEARADGDSVQCRGLALSRALAKAPTDRDADCSAAFGGADCSD